MATHRLFFRDIEVGTISDDDVDFPRYTGKYTLLLHEDASALHRHIHDYIAYSCEAWRLSVLQDDPDQSQWLAYQDANESKFIDLIECDDWYVITSNRRERILIPRFGPENQVTWQWDAS